MTQNEWDLICERMTKIINFSKTNIVKMNYITINEIYGNGTCFFLNYIDGSGGYHNHSCILKQDSFISAQDKLKLLEFYSLVKIEERLLK